jgi:FAD/FMN-containing dehydrogenase
MLLPETTKDVSQFMDVISDNHCPFGIRSGGHSAFRGANSVDDGITIDFSQYRMPQRVSNMLTLTLS